MSEITQSRNPPRARTVAEDSIEALQQRSEELASRWIATIVAARPLPQLGELPIAQLSREAPALCTQVIAALASDAALRRISEGSLPTLPAGPDARVAVQDIELLRGVLWEAALGELSDPPVRLVGDLCDRLALVCATALGAGLAQEHGVLASSTREQPHASDAVAHVVHRSAPRRNAAVLIDEHVPQPPVERSYGTAPERSGRWQEVAREPGPRTSGDEAAARMPARARRSSHGAAAPPAKGRALPWDVPLRSDAPRQPGPPGGGSTPGR